MDEERTLILGMDICDGSLQLAYLDERGEMVSVSPFSNDVGKYRIPTAICTDPQYKEWYCGNDAMRMKGREGIAYFDDLVERAKADDGEPALGGLTPTALLTHFFRIVLTALREKTGGQIIKGLTVSIKKEDEAAKQVIEKAFGQLGIESDRLLIISHPEAFMNYVVSQNKDIWINDVGLFDFGQEGLKFFVLHFGRKQQPLAVVAESTDFSDTVRYSMLQEKDDIRIKYAFESVCGIMLHKQTVSAIYATGDGFEGSWSDDILKKISTGRRIFRGQNLYVKAAAYTSHLFFEGGSENYLVIGEDALKSSMALRAVSGNELKEVTFGEVGQKYTLAGGKVDVILDNTNEIDFMIRNALKKDSFCAIMTLEALPTRKNKTNRVSVEVRFPSRNEAVVTVRDVGFGNIRKTDYRIWEQVINL